MVDDTTQFNIIFFYRECALCRQFLDPEDVNSFLAVSACHPSPGRAEWKEIDWSHLLCIGHAAASRIGVFDELPGVYLVHPCCNNVIATPNNNRSFFDCCRALGPVLHETHAPLRLWPWSMSCVVYGPVLRAIISGTADLSPIRDKVRVRLDVFTVTKERSPAELSDMVLDYLPPELALTMDCLSDGKQCLRRLVKTRSPADSNVPFKS